MWDNLAKQTTQLFERAGLKPSDVKYVVYYNSELETYQYCSFFEFMDIAADVTYSEYRPLVDVRKVISDKLQIVGTGWWLRRPDHEDEDCDGWIIERLPLDLDELDNGDDELELAYIINEEDLIDEEYVEFMDQFKVQENTQAPE